MNEGDYTWGLFSIPFCHKKIQNWKEKKSELLKLKEKNIPYIKEENIFTDFHSEYNYSQKLEKILKEELDIIYLKFEVRNYFVRKSWIEVSEKNMDHKPHNHGALGLSAVLFLDFNPKYHEPTHFISPIGNFETGDTTYFIPSNVDEGSLIVFPSMINHFTIKNDSNVPRTIISFNMSKKIY